MLDLARRATQFRITSQLTPHYSDYWTNGAIAHIPKDWIGVTSMPDAQAVDALEQHVYEWTKKVLADMKAQGMLPASVSLGNESQGGIVFPYGSTAHWDTLARFYNAGTAP